MWLGWSGNSTRSADACIPMSSAQAEEQERAWSLEQSSTLNDAYRALKDPIKRTEYLLRLEGVELEEQSKQATEKPAPPES